MNKTRSKWDMIQETKTETDSKQLILVGHVLNKRRNKKKTHLNVVCNFCHSLQDNNQMISPLSLTHTHTYIYNTSIMCCTGHGESDKVTQNLTKKNNLIN